MNKKPHAVIIDYQMSNLFSVLHALETVGFSATISVNPAEIVRADALILPGMGAFGQAMTNLKSLSLIEPMKKFIATGKPFLGVCLGMQLLFTESEEFGTHAGLDFIKGKVIVFTSSERQIRVPHVGWNQIHVPKTKKNWQDTLLQGVLGGEYMYFVHSYYPVPEDKKVIAAETTYDGISFCSAVKDKNIFATQFHPEKSGVAGMKIYHNIYAAVPR